MSHTESEIGIGVGHKTNSAACSAALPPASACVPAGWISQTVRDLATSFRPVLVAAARDAAPQLAAISAPSAALEQSVRRGPATDVPAGVGAVAGAIIPTINALLPCFGCSGH